MAAAWMSATTPAPPMHFQVHFLLFALSLRAACAADWTVGSPGVDRAGYDLNGSPIALSSNASEPCGALCAATRGCIMWSITTCGGPLFNCSLKFGAPNATQDACVTSGFSPRTLASRAHEPLAAGATAPAGWLRAQLQLEADGLTGHLSYFYPDVANSSWIGGTLPQQSTERFPYWFNGVVPLAHQLNDARLLALVAEYVDVILSRVPASGWLGPDDDVSDRQYWNKYKLLLAFSAQYEATGDERIPAAMIAHLREMARRMFSVSLGTLWSAGRVEDLVVTVAWLVERGGPAGSAAAPWLFDFADRLLKQRGNYDWAAFFASPLFPEGEVSMSSLADVGRSPNLGHLFYHGVDIGEGLKSGAVWWRFSGDTGTLAACEAGVARVAAAHGLPTGELCADECLCGAMPSHGTEVCVIVEMIFSFSVIAAATGSAAWYERAERLGLNALPAAYTKDMVRHRHISTPTTCVTVCFLDSPFPAHTRAPTLSSPTQWHHPYLHQSNEIRAVNVSTHPWLTDGPAANTYGVDGGGTGCCTTNGGTGWPGVVSAAVRTVPAVDGVALGLLLPLAANATLMDGALVRVSVDTAYPFDDVISVTVAGVPTRGLPFDIRIPSWATAATLAVNGGAPAPVGTAAGTFFRVALPQGDSTIVLDTVPAVRVSRWFNGAVAVERGALVYALQLEETVTVTKEWGYPNATDLNVTTTSPWNYALLIPDVEDPSASFNFSRTGPPGALPFGGGDAVPVSLTAWARRVNGWGEEANAAAPPPDSPACGTPGACGELERVTLVPHGSSLLRITAFPYTAA